MNTLTIFRRRAAYVLAVALVMACQVAEACPGCKQAVGGDGAGGSRQINGQAVGYAVSIGLMFFTIIAALSTLGFLMYRNCQVIAARQQADLQGA